MDPYSLLLFIIIGGTVCLGLFLSCAAACYLMVKPPSDITLLHYFFPTTSPGGRLAELSGSSASAGASGNPRHPFQCNLFSKVRFGFRPIKGISTPDRPPLSNAQKAPQLQTFLLTTRISSIGFWPSALPLEVAE